MPPDDPDDRGFEISAEVAASLGGAAAEPVLFEVARLDPARAAPDPAKPPASDRRRNAPWGLLGSLAVHLSPLLLLLSFAGQRVEIPAPIPVQLVLEQPPPPAPAAKPPLGRLASVDMGETDSQPEPEAKAPPPPQAETQMAMAAAPPKPAPPPELVSALPKPVPEAAAFALPHDAPQESPPPAPAPSPKPVVKQAVGRPPAPKAAQSPRVPGPDATRDEYLAYCERLIRRYVDMVSPAFLAGRSGVAVLSIVVLADGTISRVGVKQSSGYPDIDLRAEQMISAVRRFPPLPQWFQGPALPVNFHLAFHNGAVR